MAKRIISNIKNKKGAALILSYLVLTVLFTLMAGFALSTVHELELANQYRDSTAAFWLAEAGLNRIINDQTLLSALTDNIPGAPIYFNDAGGNPDYTRYIILEKDDSSDTSVRKVRVSGVTNDVERELQIEFPVMPPDLFSNTMSSGGNINLFGLVAKMDVYGQTRISGAYTESGFGADGWFEDKVEGVDSGSTTLEYPDADNNGTPDEFNDFTTFYNNLKASYSEAEFVHKQLTTAENSADALEVIDPFTYPAGTKIIFIEGNAPGKGDVEIWFDASWYDNENLTIVSTGCVEYFQPLNADKNSKLNIVTWEDYVEASILYSTHDGITYSHDEANFYSIFSYSETSGNLIANTAINANEALSWKKFVYADPLVDGIVPPGFEGLISTSAGGYASEPKPNSWKEL